jgi:heme/copper-type cytochrome/quinol oxidase subunit 2
VVRVARGPEAVARAGRSSMAVRPRGHRLIGALLMVALAAVVAASAPLPRSQDPVKHDITITGRDGAFTPSRLDVGLGDIVKLTLVAEGSPCSFVIDAYRISRRATPDHPVTFEFRADRAGTFAFYCDLTADERCAKMRGEMVVTAR